MILSLDPGPKQTGWCLLDAGQVADCGVEDNRGVLVLVREWWEAAIAIERFMPSGLPLGHEVADTIWWSGRFTERARNPDTVRLITRRAVLKHLGVDSRDKNRDKLVRRALIARWGGELVALGSKTQPGPLRGVTSHSWAALAVAVTAMETKA